jgi:hypothetical protein
MDAPEEKLEFLKREEVRTMAKDIAKLHAKEAREERERIRKIKTTSEPERPVPPPLMPHEEKRRPSLAGRRMVFPKARTRFEKILIRLVVAGVLVFIVFNGIAFGYWYFVVKKRVMEIIPVPQSAPNGSQTSPEGGSLTSPENDLSVVPAPSPASIIPSVPSIAEKLVTWGFRVPISARTIDAIIIDSTYNTTGGDPHDIEKVIQGSQAYRVSLHYLIDRNGAIYRLVRDEDIAYHAGTGIMPDGSRKNIINSFSLGIGLIYTKTESPNETQYQSLAGLVNYLKQKYNIPSENILLHNQIAPGVKDDPWNFDRNRFNSLIQ